MSIKEHYKQRLMNEMARGNEPFTPPEGVHTGPDKPKLGPTVHTGPMDKGEFVSSQASHKPMKGQGHGPNKPKPFPTNPTNPRRPGSR